MKSFKFHLTEELAWSGSAVDRVFPIAHSMIDDDEGDNLQLPISPKLFEKLFPKKRDTIFHVLDPHHVDDLIKMQGSKKSISAFYKMDKSNLVNGIKNDGGVVAELEGNVMMANPDDVMSRPDEQGRRWVALKYFEQDAENSDNKELKNMRNDLNWILKDTLNKHFPDEDFDFGDDNDELYDTWANMGVKADNQTKNKLIRDYYDGVSNVMKKYAPALQNRAQNYMDDKQSGSSWDELIANEVKIKNFHVLKDTLNDVKEYEPKLVSKMFKQMDDAGIDYNIHDSADNLSKHIKKTTATTKPIETSKPVSKPESKPVDEPDESNVYVGSTDKPISDSEHHQRQHGIYDIQKDEGKIRNFIQLHRGIVWETKSHSWGGLRNDDYSGAHASHDWGGYDKSKYKAHGGSYFKDKEHAINYVNGKNVQDRLHSNPQKHKDQRTEHLGSYEEGQK